MAVERLQWKDEVLAPVQTSAGLDYEPRYHILDAGGNAVVSNAKLALQNGISVAGTRHNAANMNQLMQKADNIGSFYYDGSQNVPEFTFPKAVPGSGWSQLPNAGMNMAGRPIVFYYQNKLYATFGAAANYSQSFSVACYDSATNAWGGVSYSQTRLVGPSGGVGDYRVIGNKLYVASVFKNDYGIVMCQFSLDILDLDTLVWQIGNTVQWGNYYGAGPLVIEGNGAGVYVFNGNYDNGGYDVIGEVMGYYTNTSTSVSNAGYLPYINGTRKYKPYSATYFNGYYIFFECDRMAAFCARAVETGAWAGMEYPDIDNYIDILGVVNNHLFLADFNGSISLHVADANLKLKAYSLGFYSIKKAYVAAGEKKLFFIPVMGSPSKGLSAFDTEKMAVETMPAPTVSFTNYAMAANGDSLVAAMTGTTAFQANVGMTTKGIILGHIAKGLSLSASKELYLTNAGRAQSVAPNTWSVADDDYFVCGARGMPVFGHIANL